MTESDAASSNPKDINLCTLSQRGIDWLFSADPTLRVRSSMAMLAVLLMLGSAGVMLWLGYTGLAPLQAMAWWSVVAVGGLTVMAALVRCGWSARWRDPSMTFQQILWAISCSAVAYVLAAEARGIVPGLLAVTMLFAALNLRAKQIVAVSLYALGAFSLAVLFIIQLDNSTEPALEIAYALVLVLMLTGCMLLSLRLYQLRGRLRKQRQELAVALKENRELASRDALTGLINRRHMRELLELEQRRCVRGVRTMLLAQMDIDHFKSINDTYGHGVGDMALKAFAQTVRDNIRNSDVLARWGGEEFVLLLSDTDVAGAMLTLQRVRAAVEGTTMPDAPPGLQMTVSIGLAEHMAGEMLEVTLDRADKALYSAKRAGRNQVMFGELAAPAGWAPRQAAALCEEDAL
ncbi:GGDEF domain-containing protein [Comamonas jiangduensis]|uniref:GGDEF domain-containing protein n=1 Tax=Comamonas jiangduensis TaxID=1194168 RepID=UPI0024E10A96|nr:GGDEF domain-containing protein [Comamonas jiangduensis]